MATTQADGSMRAALYRREPIRSLRDGRSNGQSRGQNRTWGQLRAVPCARTGSAGVGDETVSTTKVRRVDFGDCGPLQPPKMRQGPEDQRTSEKAILSLAPGPHEERLR